MEIHFFEIHKTEIYEDHLTLLLWNFMTIYHVLCFKPELNDLYKNKNIIPERISNTI